MPDPMQVRTFRAKSLQQALQIVRDELGPEAQVLQMREMETGLWDRLAKGRQFEVRMRDSTAVNPLPLKRPGVARATTGGRMPSGSRVHQPAATHCGPCAADQTAAEQEEIETVAAEPPSGASGDDYRRQLRQRLQENEGGLSLEELAAQVASTPAPDDGTLAFLQTTDNTTESSTARIVSSEQQIHVLRRLLDNEVDESAARELVRQAVEHSQRKNSHPAASLQEYLAEVIAGRIHLSTSIETHRGACRRVALVGATGAGKTTTIAKLAARLRLVHNRRVALITTDTFRIAAVEQLRTFAEILEIPIDVAATPRQMRDAVVHRADQDVVLIDTPGWTATDDVRLQELRAILHEARADETHLVLSAVSASSHIARVLARMRPIRPSAVLITKVDEAPVLGGLLAPLCESGLPVSYLTCGQNVPDDILRPDVATLVQLLLGHGETP